MCDRYKYSSIVVALYIIAWANHHKYYINLTKVQKLLYIAYGAALVFDKESIRLCSEHPQAWPYGPVFPTTREFLLKFGKKFEAVDFDYPNIQGIKNDAYLKSLISFVFKGFGGMTANQLTAWSHKPNTPWEKTIRETNFKWGNEIPDSFIYEYFSQLININNESGE